jgi:Zn-dependent protease with chaperone function
MKNNDVFISSLFSSSFIFNKIAYFLAFFASMKLLGGLLLEFDQLIFIQALIIGIVFWSIIRILKVLLVRLEAFQSKYGEYLADLTSAETISPLITINMLITLGQRLEVLSLLYKDFEELDKMWREKSERLSQGDIMRLTTLLKSFPIEESNKLNIKSLAPKLSISFKLYLLKHVFLIPLEHELISDLADKSYQNMVKAGIWPNIDEKSIPSGLIEKSWKDFDTDDNQFLDLKECKSFIDLLKKQPKKFIFENEISVDHLSSSHPDYRKRILNLAEFL